MENLFDLLLMFFFVPAQVITTLISISEGLDPYLFLSKDRKDAVHERRNGRRAESSLFPARVGIFLFIGNIIRVLFPICTLNWRLNIYVFRQGKGINRKNESTIIFIKFGSLWFCNHSWKLLTVLLSLQPFSLIIEEIVTNDINSKINFSLHN